MFRCHEDNAASRYRIALGGSEREITGLSFFIFEYFIFNTLYQLDWPASLDGCPVPLDRAVCRDEDAQQRAFFEFIRSRPDFDDAWLSRSFRPLAAMTALVADQMEDWTNAVVGSDRPDASGHEFRKNLLALRQLAADTRGAPDRDRFFALIEACRRYVYRVRGDIFHGRKNLAVAERPEQERRIEAYGVFLYCCLSLFFEAMGLPSPSTCVLTHAASYPDARLRRPVPRAAAAPRGPAPRPAGDATLLRRADAHFPPPPDVPSERAALFYPSAGRDLWTPLLLGLPYCRQFFFYEHDRAVVDPGAFAELYRGQIQDVEQEGWEGDEYVVRFHHRGVPRVIRWVCRDNLDFLARAVDLAFYFHRGDGAGEGGSGQLWDSELLPMLLKKIPPGARCGVVTDGEPGGLHPSLRRLVSRRPSRKVSRSVSGPVDLPAARAAASGLLAAPGSDPFPAGRVTFLYRLGRYYVGCLGPDPAVLDMPASPIIQPLLPLK
jgi:hypothetical protein